MAVTEDLVQQVVYSSSPSDNREAIEVFFEEFQHFTAHCKNQGEHQAYVLVEEKRIIC